VTQTALGAAMTRNGILAEDVEFDIAIAKYLNSGGTIARAQARLDAAAARMPGMGHLSDVAISGHFFVAQTRQPVEDAEGQKALAVTGLLSGAKSPSFNRGGDGLERVATSLAMHAIPVREPTQQQRIASAAAANVMAITIMDTLKIDGRSIGNWTVSEARKAGHLKTREGYILIQASRMVANANGGELLRHVVKAKELQKIVQKAAEVADAV
jgi:hypothetical protein